MCSPRSCITCDKWQLSPLMPNSSLNSSLMHLSMSLSFSLCVCRTITNLHNLHVSVLLLTFFFFSFFLGRKNVTIKFARRTDVMPPVPLETKHHPSSVDLLLIKRLITETSKQNLLQFLQHEFVNIGKSYAERLIGKNLKLNIISEFIKQVCI